MTTYAIKVDIQGATELAQKLRKFGSSVLDLSRSMEDIGVYFERFFAGEVFASRGGVIGKSWPALDSRYAVYKARAWPGRPPLIRTGVMNNSFKHRSTRLSTTIWNEAEYFEYHQEGQGVPQRVMMAVDATREAKVRAFVSADIDRQMRAADV